MISVQISDGSDPEPKTTSTCRFHLNQASATAKSMYPKVKVRELIPVYDHEEPLGAFDSLPIQDLNSSVAEYEDDSPRSVVRIPKSFISNSTLSMMKEAKGEGKIRDKEKAVEDSEPNMKASPILRPRAVLSSPDNDGVIGSKNKAKVGAAELFSGLKDHNQSRHTRCKVIPRRKAVKSSITPKKEIKEAADGKPWQN